MSARKKPIQEGHEDYDYHVSILRYEEIKAEGKGGEKRHTACLLPWELADKNRLSKIVDLWIRKDVVYPDAKLWHWRDASRLSGTPHWDSIVVAGDDHVASDRSRVLNYYRRHAAIGREKLTGRPSITNSDAFGVLVQSIVEKLDFPAEDTEPKNEMFDPHVFMKIVHDNSRPPFGRYKDGKFHGYGPSGERIDQPPHGS